VATFEKRGKKWRVQIMVEGVRKSSTFSTKAHALQWSIEQEALIKTGTITTGSKTLFDALERYGQQVSPTKRGCRWEQVRLKAFVELLPFTHQHLDRISPSHVTDWMRARQKTVQVGTVLRELTLLQSVFEYARRDWGWMPTNPCKDLRRPTPPKPRSQRISSDDAQKIVEALGDVGGVATTISQRVAVAFLFALETAMRSGEILALRWVDIQGRTARLATSKNGDARAVPLSLAALALLERLPKDQPLVFNLHAAQRDALFRKARDKAGLNSVHFHDARREALTKMADKVGPMELAKISGHQDLKILLSTYYAPDMQALAGKLD
jgi:integrase